MRFRVSYQHDSMQCGAACLRMVCKHYGKEYALDFLSEQCGCMIDGVSLQSIRETAEDLGFRTFAVSVGLSELQAGWCPCILHWEHNHFVVLYRIHKDKYHVADPAKGTVIYRKEDFLKRWAGDGEQGIALLLEPTQAFYDSSSGLEPEVPSPFRFLWRYIASYKKAFASVALTLLVGSLVQLVLPLLAQMMVDKGIGHKNIPLLSDSRRPAGACAWFCRHGVCPQPSSAVCGDACQYIIDNRLLRQTVPPADFILRDKDHRGSFAAYRRSPQGAGFSYRTGSLRLVLGNGLVHIHGRPVFI